MADLTDSRGQLILVSAVALAVVFIALAIVANSAIYTESLASRGDTTGSSEALEVRSEMTENIGATVIGVNQYNTTNRDNSLKKGIEDTEAALLRQGSTENRFIGVEYDGSYNSGTRIYDNTSGGSTFESPSGNQNWEVIDDTRVRRFQISLQTADIDESLGSSNEFIIQISVGGDPASVSEVYEVRIGEDGFGDDTVEVRYPSSPTRTCTIERGAEPRVVDLSRAVANGKHCEPLADIWEKIDPSDDYWITFKNGDAVQGQYTLTANKSMTPDNNPGTDHPSYSRAVYSTTVEFRYDTPKTTYRTDVRVAPGEPRD